METFKAYARQPSTWRGLALLLSAFGLAIEPGLVEQIGLGVVALIGLYDAARNEGV